MIRALVVGCPRSGTTLLQALLCSHTRLASISETHIFARMFSGARRNRLGFASADINEHVKRIAARLGQGDVASHLPSHLQREVARVFVEAADRYARAENCMGWLEKTPEHVHYLRQIERRIPDIRVVHVIRRARDVVASLYEVTRKYPESWGGEPFTVDRSVAMWVEAAERTVAVACRSNHKVVMYDDITASPESAATELWAFLGLPEAELTEEALGRSKQDVVPSNAPWQAVGGDVVARKGTKFDAVFDQAQGDQVLELLRRAVKQRGLALAGVPLEV